MKKILVKPGYKKGQALVEFVVSLIVLPLFVAGIISLARMHIVRIRLHQGARHGAFLMATNRVSESTMKAEINKFFEEGHPKFDMSKVKINKPEEVKVGMLKGYKVTVSYRFKVFDLGKLNFWKGSPKIEKTYKESVVCAKQSLKLF